MGFQMKTLDKKNVRILSRYRLFHMILILSFLFILTGLSSCKTRRPSDPSQAMGSNLENKFQSTLDALREQFGFPGATAAYVLKDGAIGVAATGYADIEAKKPMMVRSRMLPASIGKTFVGATAEALAIEGALDLDIPISRWLGEQPWFSRLPNHEAITMRHLLTHGSGLRDHVHMDSFAAQVSRMWRKKENPFPPEALVQFVLDLPPLFKPGTGWSYSDTGYILAGLVIEKAAHKPYYDEIRDRFLIPLGLKSTSPADRRNLPGLAAGYMAADNAFGFPNKTTDASGVMAWHPGLEWTGGGLVSNSRDLALWGSALYGGKAMPKPYLNELLHSVPVSRDEENIRYGLGVGIYLAGPLGPVYGHGGWIPGYSSSLRYYPDYKIAVAFQINTDLDLLDSKIPVMREMETRLAEVVISDAHR